MDHILVTERFRRTAAGEFEMESSLEPGVWRPSPFMPVVFGPWPWEAWEDYPDHVFSLERDFHVDDRSDDFNPMQERVIKIFRDQIDMNFREKENAFLFYLGEHVAWGERKREIDSHV